MAYYFLMVEAHSIILNDFYLEVLVRFMVHMLLPHFLRLYQNLIFLR